MYSCKFKIRAALVECHAMRMPLGEKIIREVLDAGKRVWAMMHP